MSITVFQDSIEQIWNKGDSSAIERFIAPNYFGVDPAEPEVISGIEGYRQHFFRLTTAFPDAHITIDHIFGVNDQVAARYTVEATHTGDFGGIPPTGRRVRVTAIAIAKITRGKIVVEHAHSDALGRVLTQLGVIEDPPRFPHCVLRGLAAELERFGGKPGKMRAGSTNQAPTLLALECGTPRSSPPTASGRARPDRTGLPLVPSVCLSRYRDGMIALELAGGSHVLGGVGPGKQ